MKKLILFVVIIYICCFSIAISASFEETKHAAEQGDASAQYSLGHYYYLQQDYKQCKEWSEKAAEQGHVDAQIELGLWYYWGEDADQDYQKARQWFEKAADKGSADAQFFLGKLYDSRTPRS